MSSSWIRFADQEISTTKRKKEKMNMKIKDFDTSEDEALDKISDISSSTKSSRDSAICVRSASIPSHGKPGPVGIKGDSGPKSNPVADLSKSSNSSGPNASLSLEEEKFVAPGKGPAANPEPEPKPGPTIRLASYSHKKFKKKGVGLNNHLKNSSRLYRPPTIDIYKTGTIFRISGWSAKRKAPVEAGLIDPPKRRKELDFQKPEKDPKLEKPRKPDHMSMISSDAQSTESTSGSTIKQIDEIRNEVKAKEKERKQREDKSCAPISKQFNISNLTVSKVRQAPPTKPVTKPRKEKILDPSVANLAPLETTTSGVPLILLAERRRLPRRCKNLESYAED